MDFGGFDFNTVTSATWAYSQVLVQNTSTLGRKMGVIKPAGAGNYNAWSGDFNALSDASPATVVASNTAAQRQSSTLAAWGGASAGAIEKIVLRADASAQGGAPTGLSQFVRIGTTDYDGTTVVPGGSVVPTFREILTNPATTNPWLFTELSTLQIGLLSVA
jgi:hypothetical protein